jgi:terminase, large subunit
MRKLLTGVQWADKHFKLPEGSSQIAGQWTTQPVQVVMLNLMTNDRCREFGIQKSARLGYTKVLVASVLYMAEHKKRSSVVFQPIDDEADGFVVDEVDPVIAEMKVIKAIFPEWEKKNEKNNLKKKVMKGVIIDFRGGDAAGRYRRLTKQCAFIDEADALPREVGKGKKGEGNPLGLARKRLKGAAYPKFVVGTTPTVKRLSHIEDFLSSAEIVIRFYLPCPHCKHEQVLVWGGRDAKFGLTWDDTKTTRAGKANSAHYVCESCHDPFHYADLYEMEIAGRWIGEDGTWTRTGEDDDWYTADGERIPCPESVGMHVWAAYSLNLDGWGELVMDWLKAEGKPLDEKTFINTTLGELYEEEIGEPTEHSILLDRREQYAAEVPDDVVYITVGVDSQRDRYEIRMWGWTADEQAYLIDKIVVMGKYDDPDTLQRTEKALKVTYRKADGTQMTWQRGCWDTGGIDQTYVNNMSKRFGIFKLIPIKGANVYGKPIANFPSQKNRAGVYHTEVGSDTAKELLYSRYHVELGKPGSVHLPLGPMPSGEMCDEAECQQLTAEVKVLEIVAGKTVVRWRAKGRNEGTDCFAYALAALRISQIRWGLKLATLVPKPDEQEKTASPAQTRTMAELAQQLNG